MPVLAHGQMTADEFIKAQYLHLRPSRLYGIFLLALTALLTYGVIFQNNYKAAGVLVVSLLIYGIWLPVRSRRMYSQNKALSDIWSFEIVETGIKLVSETANVLLSWERIRKWRMNAELILIYPADGLFYVLPRRFFLDGSSTKEFEETMSTCVGRPT